MKAHLATLPPPVLTEDYLTVPEDRIRTIRSAMTFVGGKVVYEAEPSQAAEKGQHLFPLPRWQRVGRWRARAALGLAGPPIPHSAIRPSTGFVVSSAERLRTCGLSKHAFRNGGCRLTSNPF